MKRKICLILFILLYEKVDYVHAILKDDQIFNNLGLDQRAEVCMQICDDLRRNIQSKEILRACIKDTKEFTQVILACGRNLIKNNV